LGRGKRKKVTQANQSEARGIAKERGEMGPSRRGTKLGCTSWTGTNQPSEGGEKWIEAGKLAKKPWEANGD